MIRIGRLDLERWGHFEGRSIAFAGAGRLHVVYGDNEAGKSTTRRAVSALLFGVPARTVDVRGRAYGDLRVGALLELDGTPTELVRRKGNKDTLLDPEGRPVDAGPLLQALGGLTADVHAGLFEVTHGSLVEGGQELLEGRGAVGESLFAAAAGTSRLHRLLRGLEEEADAIFTPRGTKKELNAALRAYDTAVKALRDTGLRPPEHARLAAEVRELEAQAQAAGDALVAVQREIERLGRLGSAGRFVARRGALLREREQLGDVPALAPDAVARREQAAAERDRAVARERAAAQAVDRVAPQLDALDVDEALLARADEVLDLLSRAAAVQDDAEQRSGAAAALAQDEAALERLVAGLATALGGQSLEAISLDEEARERLDRCLEARAGVEHAAAAAAAAAEEARRQADADARALQAATAVPDEAGLIAALRAARPAAASEQAVGTARTDARAARERAARAAREAAAAASAGMGPAGDDLVGALAGCAVPPADTLERLLAEHVELADAERRLGEEQQRLADERDALAAERAGLAGAVALPAPGALAAARAARDAQWEQVRRALTAPAADPAGVATAFEAAMSGADAIADQQLQHADEVARVAAVDRQLAQLDARSAALAGRRERHAAAVEAVAEAWVAAWRGAGGLAPSPATAGTWLAARDAMAAQLAEAAEADRRAEHAAAEVERHAGSLRAALTATGGVVADGASLAALLEQAEAHAAVLRERRTAREQLAQVAQRSLEGRIGADADAERAEARRAAWQAGWEQLRGDCGLDAALSPDGAQGVLRRLADAEARRVRAGELRRELTAIDERAERLERDVTALCAAVAPDLVDTPVRAAAAALHRRVDAARAAQEKRSTLQAELAAHEQELRAAQAEAEAAEAQLAGLRAAAGAADDAELALIEERAGRAASLRAELATLETDIAAAGGATLEQVLAAVDDLDADALPARVEALEAERDTLRERRDAAREALVRAGDRLGELERSAEAAEAAQAAAGQLATVRALAERYARARLAQRVLRDAIERYRREHEGPMLARANELFPALTCGRFGRLLTELDDDDQWVLVAEAADGERRRVEQLSDGTREQLFLALRLSAIERYVEMAGPMPVVFDDVLLESDDARATEILRALGDLAERTQVIVLTHHQHLVALAGRTLGDERLDLIELSSGLADPGAGAERAGGAAAGVAGEPEPALAEADAAADVGAPSLRDELEAAMAAPSADPAPGEQSSLL